MQRVVHKIPKQVANRNIIFPQIPSQRANNFTMIYITQSLPVNPFLTDLFLVWWERLLYIVPKKNYSRQWFYYSCCECHIFFWLLRINASDAWNEPLFWVDYFQLMYKYVDLHNISTCLLVEQYVPYSNFLQALNILEDTGIWESEGRYRK